MQDDQELAVIESIYDALDGERPDRALEMARQALGDAPDDDPVLRLLAGRALIELDRPGEAVAELERAVTLDGEDAEFRSELAGALYLAARFDTALDQARKAVELDDAFPDGHHVLGLCLERLGPVAEADAHFGRAAELDPESFARPCRVSDAEFHAQVEAAREALPDDFRAHLERVALIVEEFPSESLLFEELPPLSPELLGLYTGVPLDQQGPLGVGGELPSRIYLFKRTLERTVTAPDELADQIRITLFHELGHYLGLDEEDLERAGYA